jgi:hypothetical protein
MVREVGVNWKPFKLCSDTLEQQNNKTHHTLMLVTCPSGSRPKLRTGNSIPDIINHAERSSGKLL